MMHMNFFYFLDTIEETIKKEFNLGDNSSKDLKSNTISQLFDYRSNSYLKCKLRIVIIFLKQLILVVFYL